MAWNGSGTFSRIVTTVSPAVGGTTIDVADQNSFTSDVTDGINACLAKNGENAATSDIDFGSNQVKAVADGTLATDAPNVGQVQDSAYSYAADTGSANAYVIALSPTLTAYSAGLTIRFKASAANTGASTINIDSLGAKNIKTPDLNDLGDGLIKLNGVYTIIYDGTQFQLQHIQRSQHVTNTNGSPTISDVVFAADGMTVTNFESIGPTGSSADNIWTALDSVPAGVDWIEVSATLQVTVNGTSLQLLLSARGTGSGYATNAPMYIAVLYQAGVGTGSRTGQTVSRGVKIPVDSDVTFECRWSGIGDTFDADLYLTGYGWN